MKRIKGDLFMTYREATLHLPNPEMALYHVQTLHVELQARLVNMRAPQRTTSERFVRQQELVWHGADPA